MKIFIVDDESEVVKLYTLFLRNRGDEIIATSNATSAIDLIKENSFDLIITDRRMPQVSGDKIINYVENHIPMTPIFLLTGDKEVSHDFINPKSKIIIKPIMMTDLIEHVEEVEKSIYTTIFDKNVVLPENKSTQH